MGFVKKIGGLVLGAVGAVVGFIAGGPAGAVIGFSIGMGIGAAAQYAAMQTDTPSISSATDSRLSVSIDVDENRKIAFGETALGTDQRYWETYGAENSQFDQVIAAAGHEIYEFGALYFDDELVEFSGNAATGDYSGALSKEDRLVGVTGTALTVGAGTKWTSSASMTGIAHYALKINYSQEKFPRGIPTRITRVGKGALVYDPRRDSTVTGGSGTHRADDQTTWEYAPVDSNGEPIGRNPALQLLWYQIGWRVTNPDTLEEILVCGQGRPLDDIEFESFITAANDCEENEYYSDVLLSTGDAHQTNTAVLEAACAGKLMDNGGRIGLRIRTDTTGDIVQAFGEGDVLDAEASVWTQRLPLAERWNQGVGSFVDPESLFQLTPLPTVRDTTYETEDGFQKAGPSFRFDAVQDPAQAQKLVRLALNISRFQGVFVAPFNWAAKKVRVWDCVTLDFPRLGFSDKVFRVLDKRTDPMGAIWLMLREDDPSIYTPGTVTPLPPPGVGAGYDPRVVSVPLAGDWTVTPQYIEGGGIRLPAFGIEGQPPARTLVATHVEYRYGVSGDWQAFGRFGGTDILVADRTNIIPGGSYYFRLRYENTFGVLSSGLVLGPYTAPSEFVVLGSLLADSFVGQGALATLDQVTWATEVTGVGKPEDYATNSVIYRQETAPGSPNANDIWVQTSGGTPVSVHVWNGSSWVTGADITLLNTAAAITGQGWGATADESEANNLLAGFGGNRLFHTNFLNLNFWAGGGNGTLDSFFAYAQESVRILRLRRTGLTSGQRINLTSFPQRVLFPVRPGQFIGGAMDINAVNVSSARLELVFRDGAGTTVAGGVVLLESRTTDLYSSPSDMTKRYSGIGVVPAGAETVEIRADVTSNGTSPTTLWIARPQLYKARASNAAVGEYQAGFEADEGADVTDVNTAAAIAGQGGLATADEASVRKYDGISVAGFEDSYVTFATVTITTDGGPVELEWSARFELESPLLLALQPTTAAVYAAIYRGGGQVYGEIENAVWYFDEDGDELPYSSNGNTLKVLDSPPAGTYTYTLRFRCSRPGSDSLDAASSLSGGYLKASAYPADANDNSVT